MDLVAAVEACRADELAGVRVVLPDGDHGRMLVAGIKMLSEALDEEGIDGGWVREWSRQAVSR